MKSRNVALAILILLFTSPYFFALFVSKFRLGMPQDLTGVITSSLLQATLSALAALALGIVGAAGLLRRSSKWEFVALAPVVAPAIALVLGFFSLFPQWKGISAVVVAHALSSAGLVAVVLSRQIRGSLGGSLELGWIEGASRRTLWRRGVLPSLRADLLRLGLSVFAASLASFSIPLLLGGSRAVTIEIAIHHAIRFENSWSAAATLSILQWALLLMFVLLLRTPDAHERRSESDARNEIGRVLGSDFAILPVLVAPAMILYALLRGPVLGFAQMQSAGLFDHVEVLQLAARGSIASSTIAGLAAAMVLAMFAAAYPSAKVRVWISGYVAPSVAITGFATLVIGWGENPSFVLDIIRIATGAALLFAPVLWRLRWEQSLARLDGQVKVAETLGAPHAMIVRKVLAPQLRELVFWSAGLVSFWVWGDYALGSIAASRPMTLALVAKGLLESYRLEAASILVLTCLVLGGFSYRIFVWGGSPRVTR